MKRKCTKCNLVKETSEFWAHKKSSDGINWWCKDCCKSARKNWYKNNADRASKNHREWYANNPEYRRIEKQKRETIARRIVAWKRTASRRDIPWELSDGFFKEIPSNCFYTGMPLTLVSNSINTISLDRIDSTKSYREDNVVFCCKWINVMKSDRSREELIKICEMVVLKKDEILAYKDSSGSTIRSKTNGFLGEHNG